MKNYLIGIDNGGTLAKAGLFDYEGHQIAVASESIRVQEPHLGWVERDMEEVYQANVRVVKGVIEKAGIDPADVLGIGLTGYGNGICFIDKEGAPVYSAVVSSDSRASALCEELTAAGVEDIVYPLTAQGFWPAQTAILTRWFKDNMPEVIEKTATIISMKDYIRFRLTGRRCYELTEMTCSGLMNIHDRTFDDRIFEALGIEDCKSKMPEFTEIFGISGYLTEAASAETGLPTDVFVAGSCYDINTCAMAGGVCDDTKLSLIAGTWSINEVLTKELIDGADSIASSYLDGYYIMEESSPTSASNFNWFIDKLLKGSADITGNIYDYCNEAVASLPPEDSDVIFVPYLYDSATHPDARGAFMNLKAFHDKKHLIRAIYEGIVFSAMHHVERIRELGVTFETATLSGGVTNSDVWSQIFCDTLGIPLAVSQSAEPAALGAAMCVAIAGGVYKDVPEAQAAMVHIGKIYSPVAERHAVYQRKFKAYNRALAALDHFCELAEE